MEPTEEAWIDSLIKREVQALQFGEGRKCLYRSEYQ
jgi:hypothetical protein